MAYYTAGVVGSYFRGAVAPNGFDISGSTVSATNLLMSGGTIRDTSGLLDISGSTIRTSNFLIASGGTIRDTSGNIDISGSTIRSRNFLMASGGTIRDTFGNIDISESTVRANNFLMSGGTIRDTAGFLDISGGNLTVAGVINAGAIATPGIAPTNIVVPGYIRDNILSPNMDISGGNIRIAGTFTGSTVNTSNQIGGVTLSNNNVSNTGTTTSSNFIGVATASNMIGGVTLSNFDICLSATGRILGVAGNSNTIGGVTLSNTNISNANASSNQIAGVLLSNGNISNGITSSNVIGGITLSNSILDATRIIAPVLRNAVTPSAYDISGGNISNSGVTTTSNIRVGASALAASTALIDTGRGADNNGGDGTPLLAMQYSGGGYRHFVRGRHNAAPNSSGNAVDFFTNNSTEPQDSLAPGAGGNRLAASITSAGVGVGISNPAYALDVSGTTETDNALVSGYLRNNLTATQFDISGGNIRNVGKIQTGTGYTLSVDASDTITAFSDIRTHAGSFVGVSESQYLVNGAEWPLLRSYTFSNGIWTYKTATTTGGLIFKTQISGTTAERMRIGAAGGLGIGTTVPVYALDVSSANGTNMALRNTSGQASMIIVGTGFTDASGLQIFQSATAQGLYQANSMALSLWTKGAQRFTIDQSGNTGIGTTTPLNILDVNGVIANQGGQTATGYARLLQGNATNSGFIEFWQGTAAAARVGYIGFVDNSTCQISMSNRSTVFLNGSTEIMRVGSNGNVGIGTTAPDRTLDISSAADPAVVLRNRGGNATIRLLGSSLATDSCGMQIYQGTTGQGIWVNNTAPFQIQSNGAIRFTIASAGNVGIGTTAPAYQLDVSGTIRGSSNIVAVATASNWIGAAAGFTDTSLTLSYTPKQAGTVRLFVEASAEYLTGGGTGADDGAIMTLRNNGTALTSNFMAFTDVRMEGRALNSFAGGRMATVDVTGTSLINIRFQWIGNDTPTVKNAFLRVMELSTT